MKKTMKKAILATVFVLVATGIAFGSYHAYQRHASIEVRNAASGAANDDVSMAQFEQYLHDARLASRTKRDAEIVGAMDAVETADKKRGEDEGLVDTESDLMDRDTRSMEVVCYPGNKKACDDAYAESKSDQEYMDSLIKQVDSDKQAEAESFFSFYRVIGEPPGPTLCQSWRESLGSSHPGCPK